MMMTTTTKLTMTTTMMMVTMMMPLGDDDDDDNDDDDGDGGGGGGGHCVTKLDFFLQNLFLSDKMKKNWIKPVLTSFFRPKLSKTDHNWTK